MVLSKKEGLILAVAGIAGVGVALTLAGGSEKEEGDEKEKQMKKQELMLRYEAPVYSPSTITAPYSESNITRIIHNILAPAPAPGQEQAPAAITPGVSNGSKKTYKSAGMALGYEGYVTPSKPSPVSPGYIPGVTKFVPHKEGVYIPSPVAPPYVAKTPVSRRSSSGGGGGSRTAAKKAISHAKMLRARRGD